MEARLKTLYRCDRSKTYTTSEPDCFGCFDQSCMYNRGFVKNPPIKIKYQIVDTLSDTVIFETPEQDLFQKE